MDKKPDKQLLFVGDSRDEIRAFPDQVRIDAGHALRQVQQGLLPSDWKTFDSAGAGAMEIRLRDKDGWYRVIYVSKFEEAVYVLHAFQKKTNQTSQSDSDLAERAYKAVVRQRVKR
jgi:phage-related protein